MENYKLSIGDVVQYKPMGLKYIVIQINDKVWLDLYASKENIELYGKVLTEPAWESMKFRMGGTVIKEKFFGVSQEKMSTLVENETVKPLIAKRLLFERLHGINKRNNV